MNFFYRMQSDKGASNAISFIVIILFIMTLLVAFVDVGLYFNTKNQMMSAAENGARSVALYGGVDTVVRRVRGNISYTPIDVVWDSIPNSLKKPGMKTVVVNKSNISCKPMSGRIKAGDMVSCEITYIYNGIAGRFGLFKLGNSMKGSTNAPMKVIGSSVSEVTIE